MALFDAFLKIEGIDGESADAKHKGEIAIESWSFGAHQESRGVIGAAHGAGKVQFQDIHFVKVADKASPKLMLACADGEHFKKATLVCRKAGKDQQEFLKIELTDVLVSSYHIGGSGHGDTVVPTDQFSLSFAKIVKEYKEQKPDGTLGGAVRAGWDVKSNKAL